METNRIMNTKMIILLVVTIVLSSLFVSYIANFVSNTSNNKQETEIEFIATKNPCTADGKSNLEWIACEQDFLTIINKEKERYFNKLITLLKANSEKMLANDPKLLREFLDWYESSNNANYTRCLAEMYYTRAGSAYKGNMAYCQSREAQRDIGLINNTFNKFIDIHNFDYKVIQN